MFGRRRSIDFLGSVAQVWSQFSYDSMALLAHPYKQASAGRGKRLECSGWQINPRSRFEAGEGSAARVRSGLRRTSPAPTKAGSLVGDCNRDLGQATLTKDGPWTLPSGAFDRDDPAGRGAVDFTGSLDFTGSNLSGSDRRAGGMEVNAALGDVHASVTIDR
jgi:hypothetical protein